MNRVIVDFLTFSVRIDAKSSINFNSKLNFEYICDFLRIPPSEFSNMGRIKYYKERYECNNISISVPFDGREGVQGYNISMSGNGCRFYEAYTKQGEMIDVYDIWRNLFARLRSLTCLGLSVNISRIDIAVDDFSGALNMDKIINCVERDEIATRFQKKMPFRGNCDMYIAQSSVKTSFFRRIKSSTVEFGSRQSRSFCRIYDKKAEQMQRHYNDEKEFKRLEAIPHWVRLEVEFKDENAIKIVNAFIDQSFFPHFFAGYINNMLRFVDRDDSNVSRCTVQKWWQEFIGTTHKTSMACGDYKPLTRKRHLEYVYKMLSGSIYTAINLEGLDDFLLKVINTAQERLSLKHRKLCGGLEWNINNLCNSSIWQFLRPSPETECSAYEEYHYTGRLAGC